MTDSPIRRVLLWLFFCLLLGGIPASIVYSTIYRHLSLAEQEHLSGIKATADMAATQARLNENQEKYWCRILHSNYLKWRADNTSAEQIKGWLRRLRTNFPDELEFIAWDQNGIVVEQTFSSIFTQAEWHGVFKTLAYYFSYWNEIDYSRKFQPDLETTKKVLGEQYLPESFQMNFDQRLYSLAYLDATMQKPVGFSFFFNHGGYLLLFDHTKFDQLSGLKKFLQSFAKTQNIEIGLFSPSKKEIWSSFSSTRSNDLLNQLEYSESHNLDLIQQHQSYLLSRHVAGDLRLFIMARKIYPESKIFLYAIIGTGIFLLLVLPLFLFLYRTMVNGLPGNVSIRLKLTVLFAFASGIPLLVLGIISQENYVQKRSELMNQGKKEITDLIVNFDNRFEAHLAKIAVSVKDFLHNITPDLLQKGLDPDILKKSCQKVNELKGGNFFIVSSDTNRLVSNYGLIDFKGELDNASVDFKKSQLTRSSLSPAIQSDLKTANLIGKKLLSDLNNTPFPLATINKLELVAETLMQKPFVEILHSVISNFDSLGLWGFGRALDYGFSKLISVRDKTIFDYLTLVFWRPQMLQSYYVEESIEKISKNPSGIKIIAIRNGDEAIFPENTELSNQLNYFSKTLIDKPNDDIQIINMADKKYIAVGFKGIRLNEFRLIALYPLEIIDRRIDRQREEVILFSIFCLLFAFGLAQTLFRNFLKPVVALKNGALAIEERNFTHRISISSKDEFGQIADIFNDVMIGLEELEVAKIVQESLFPPSEFTQNNFLVYGKSVTMSELGGDYFDFFKIDEENFAILMGDVAGHGVGAAVIMAMAKAAVLNSPHLLTEPDSLLLNLHQMILASKSSKQRKVMTFQYLCVNSLGNAGIYSNAGACSPILIENQGKSVRELPLAGAALGAFKKAKYQSLDLSFKSGDALVFYTDGIVETRNAKDEEIGYDGLSQILLDSYDTNPQKFYDNVFARYQNHLGQLDAQDDLTILIMVCQEE